MAGVVALAISGIGPMIAAGPIAAALGGLGIGTAAGGVIGLLRDHGITEEEAEYYAEGLRRGGAVVAVHARGDRAGDASGVLNQNGAADVANARKSGAPPAGPPERPGCAAPADGSRTVATGPRRLGRSFEPRPPPQGPDEAARLDSIAAA